MGDDSLNLELADDIALATEAAAGGAPKQGAGASAERDGAISPQGPMGAINVDLLDTDIISVSPSAHLPSRKLQTFFRTVSLTG